MTDEELYQRFLREGKSEYIQDLLERYRESLTLFLYGYVHNMDDAEELMLDAFAIAVSKTASFRGKSSFKTWLFGIGKNQAFHFMRRQKHTVEQHLDDLIKESAAIHTETPEMKLLQEEKTCSCIGHWRNCSRITNRSCI